MEDEPKYWFDKRDWQEKLHSKVQEKQNPAF